MEYVWLFGIVCLLAGGWQLIKSYKPSQGNVTQRMAEQQRKQSGDMGFIAAAWDRRVVTARAERNSALTKEVETIYELDLLPRKKDRAEQLEVVLHHNLLLVTEEASRHKLGASAYETLKTEEGMAQIRLLEAQGLSDIEWDKIEKQHRLEIEGAMLLFIKEHGAIKGMRELFTTLVRQRDEIAKGEDSPEVTRRLLERYDKDIEFLDGAMDAKNRLLQDNGQDA